MEITASTIKFLRKAAEQTQEEYAKTLNVSRSLIAMIESGQRKVSTKMATKIIAQIIQIAAERGKIG